MKNIIKLLIFNILLFTTPAAEAMGTLRSRLALCARAKMAQSAPTMSLTVPGKIVPQSRPMATFAQPRWKTIQPYVFKSPFNQKFNGHNDGGSGNGGKGGYTFTHKAALPLVVLGLVYDAYDRIKAYAGYMPSVTEENIEKYPQYKDQFIQYACEHELYDVLRMLVKKYPESASDVSFNVYNLLLGPQKSVDTSQFLSQKFEELSQSFKWSKVTNSKIQSLFDNLKIKMGVSNEISLLATADPQIGSDAACISMHNIVLINSESKLPEHVWEFVLAHELAHILKNHTAYHYFIDDAAQKLFVRRNKEYEADAIAVLTLGSIAGAMELLNAIPDRANSSGWRLPADKDDSTKDHPSNANRCRALLALVEKHPEKFKK